MDKAKFDQIVERANEQEKITLTVLYNAVGKALKNVNAGNTAAAINDWKKSENAYNETEARLWAKYFEPTPPNILAVVAHLTAAGWKISKSTAYNHRKAGHLKQEADGSFKISAVEQYAVNHLIRKDGRQDDGVENLAEDKQRAETRKARAQAEHWELKTKIARGLYVPKDAFERELAQRAIIFKSDGETFFRSQAAAMVALVGGDNNRIPDLVEYTLTAFAGWLNRYSAEQEFIVPVAEQEAVLDNADDADPDGEDAEE